MNSSLINPFILAGVVGFVGWVWTLWREHNSLKADMAALKLHIAENYPRNGSLNELQREVRHIAKIVERIAGKVGVSTEERSRD